MKQSQAWVLEKDGKRHVVLLAAREWVPRGTLIRVTIPKINKTFLVSK